MAMLGAAHKETKWICFNKVLMYPFLLNRWSDTRLSGFFNLQTNKGTVRARAWSKNNLTNTLLWKNKVVVKTKFDRLSWRPYGICNLVFDFGVVSKSKVFPRQNQTR